MANRSDVTYEGQQDRPAVAQAHDEMHIIEDLTQYFVKYARQRPQTVALICLGVGFVLGWKLKPW